MSATVYGLPSGALTPRNDFRATTDNTGRVNATMSFSLRRGAYSSIQAFLHKGKLLTNIYTEGDSYFDNLIIDSHEYAENEGGGNGIDIIRVNLLGYFESSAEVEEKEKVYELTTSLGEAPIIRHPKFLLLNQDVNSAANGMVRLYNGTARFEKNTSGYKIVDIMTGNEIVTITGGDEHDFFECIFIRDNRTYKVPVSEYTETQTNMGGLTDAEVEYLGKIDNDPPRDPATPPNMIWMLTGSSETRSSENPITWNRTWSTIEDTADNVLLYEE